MAASTTAAARTRRPRFRLTSTATIWASAVDVGAMADVAGASEVAPLNTSSMSVRASPMSRRRRLTLLSRQRSSSRRMGTGVAAGRTDQSGSRSRIAAIVSESVSPANASRPVSIS